MTRRYVHAADAALLAAADPVADRISRKLMGEPRSGGVVVDLRKASAVSGVLSVIRHQFLHHSFFTDSRFTDIPQAVVEEVKRRHTYCVAWPAFIE